MKGMKYNDAKFTLDNLGNAVRVHARVRKYTLTIIHSISFF